MKGNGGANTPISGKTHRGVKGGSERGAEGAVVDERPLLAQQEVRPLGRPPEVTLSTLEGTQGQI